MKSIRDIPHFEGVKILVRADFNVPIKNGAVADDFRIRAALPTIDFLREKGAKIILISHIEANEGGNPSLKPIADHLKSKLKEPVTFLQNIKNANEFINQELKDGKCVLLENLRFNDGEKNNDAKFAKELASLADIYVNEAFPVSHRAHASIVGVPKFLLSYAGFQFEREVGNLSKAFNPTHPFFFILGGAKFETKLPLIEKFSKTADEIFVGGALANDIFKAKGYEVGKSTVSESTFHLPLSTFLLPIDVVNQNKEIKSPDSLSKDDSILDAGPKTVELLRQKVNGARFILWNGPLGMYEDGYREPTIALAEMIGAKTQGGKETQSIVGGGDTLAAIATLKIEDQFTFVSTGGGAMLDFLAMGTLPGIDALNGSAS